MGTNTGIGIGIGIPFRNNALGGDNMYFPPELKARMIGVWDNYGKKNTDADRNIIKNKIPNAGGDLEILNSAYRLNSGFGGYSNDFQEYTYHENVVIKTDTNAVFNAGGQLLIPYSSLTKDIPSFKIKVSGLSNTYHFRYYYRDNNGVQHSVNMVKDGNYELPICYNVQNSSDGTDCGFANNGSDIVTVEILPAFEGALVTDGINDIITSIKTLEEWNIGDKGITIVSMIHQINTNTNNFITTNNIRTDNKVIGRNIVSNIEKTGIYGWYKENIQSDTINVINNILGDKNDYTSHSSPSTNINSINNSKFYVQGYAVENGFAEISSIAHYWTFAVLGKATEDEINLIIAKYNLDRTLRPDILCNITKQGITNDNHADFNDKLIDYSGNGRDIQMYNLAWKGGSGVAAKQYETFKDWTSESSSTSIIKQIDEFTRIVESTTNGYLVSRIKRDSDLDKVYSPINVYLYQDNNFLVHECKYEVDGVKYAIPINEPVGKGYHKLEMYTKDRYTELPENAENVVLSEWYFPKSTKGSIKYSIIPSCKGGILLDGINDFGKVTGMPIYKDYTFIIEREFLNETFLNQVCLVSKSKVASEIENGGAFIVDNISVNSIINPYSFYKTTSLPGLNTFDRQIVFQSKYKYLDKDIAAGTSTDSDTLWLGTFRDNDQRFFNGAIYSLMSFPYSMSKFLIERQLKKHKLGTLYPNMVEFRPVIKTNVDYTLIQFYINNYTKRIYPGDYIPINTPIQVNFYLKNNVDELISFKVNGNDSTFKRSTVVDNAYNIETLPITKSPQKINITIDEYIRFEDIIQPYPVLLRFNDENGNEVSWGGKFRVGSTITRIGGIDDTESNLLNGLYSISGLSLNGKAVTSSTSIVEKQMVFRTTATWLLDNNEPKCILSPRLLRIPNSSYKILGYIPDISGHGNHGKINNSAYAGMSGANGYVENFNEWRVSKDNVVITRTDSKATITKIGINSNTLPFFQKDGSVLINNYVLTVNITGIPEGVKGKFIHNNLFTKELIEGKNTITLQNDAGWYGFTFYNENNAIIGDCNITIEQIGEYEGAYCLDGVDDFVTIPTLSSGGKQVLMKVNWNSLNHVLYDQRNNAEAPFCIVTASGTIAYNQRNVGGNTYIDGILNNHILVDDLQAITHNIVLNNDYNVANSNSFIGTNYTKSIYAQMALYDFMLFDNISTDDKIKELNEYVGIEGNTEWRKTE
jgi:hypothetical protein